MIGPCPKDRCGAAHCLECDTCNAATLPSRADCQTCLKARADFLAVTCPTGPTCKACRVPLTSVGHGIGYECLNDACTGCGGTRAIGVPTDEKIECPITGRRVGVTKLIDCPGCGDCAS